MTELKNSLEIYRLLPKTNCGDCSVPTCLAFSAAVIKGDKELAHCPHLTGSISELYTVKTETQTPIEQNREESARQLKSKISSVDLLSSAERLGANIVDGKLAIKSLGKHFFVDSRGNITSECHTHSWITIPLLDYILHSRGGNISGEWVPFRELKNGAAKGPLFGQMCEKPLKKIADTYTDLFSDLIYIFSGDRTTNMFSSDVSLILYPLPKVPVLICYWEPEDGMESSLHIFFDSTVEDHLDIESVYTLGVGLAMMFERIALKHIHD